MKYDAKYFGQQVLPGEPKQPPSPLKRMKSGAAAIADHIPRQGSPTNPYLAGAEIIVEGGGENDKDPLGDEEEEFISEGI